MGASMFIRPSSNARAVCVGRAPRARSIIRTWWWGRRSLRAGSRNILPLDDEEVSNEDGAEKQDCEINAGQRLARRLRHEHRQLSLCVTGDDLYAHEPCIEELREL